MGADTYGQVLLDSLTSHGVDVGGVARPASLKTGMAIIIVDEPTGQNRIVLSPEANHQGMAPGDFEGAIWPRTITSSSSSSKKEGKKPDLLIMQLEVPLQTVLLALSAARRGGIPVLLNPAPAVTLPDDAYQGLAHLVVNETEAAALAGVPVDQLDTEEGCRGAAAVFVRRGVRAVIITLGGRGVYYMCGGAEGLIPAEGVREVVDTTAAGDTFVGQYALEVVGAGAGGAGGKGEEEFDVAAAVRKANKASAITVQRKGAAASIPWRDEVVMV